MVDGSNVMNHACYEAPTTEKCTFDGSNHCTIASPLLGIRQMSHSIQVGCNEEAPGILSYTKACILDLVVVDSPVKAHDHSPNLDNTNFNVLAVAQCPRVANGSSGAMAICNVLVAKYMDMTLMQIETSHCRMQTDFKLTLSILNSNTQSLHNDSLFSFMLDFPTRQPRARVESQQHNTK